MVLPVSVDLQLRRLGSQLSDLKRSESEEEQSIIVAEICNSCVLLLDKLMNKLWELKVGKDSGKPRIYFPVCSSREKLVARFQQYQMPDILSNEPNIFNVIDSAQDYNGTDWLSSLHRIASMRHEKFPEVNKIESGGIGLGVNQDIYIESFVAHGGNMSFQGYGINRKTGKKEPVIVEFTKEVRSVLNDIKKEPYDFCHLSVEKVKKIVSSTYMLLGK